MKAFVVSVAAAAAGAATGCGGGGQLSGAGGAGMIMTGSGATGVVGGTGAGGSTVVACTGTTELLPHLTPDILIVVDTSASMNDGFDGACAGGCGPLSKWSAAAAGIDTVVSSTQLMAVNWGLKLLGAAGNACDAGGIDVAVGPTTDQQIRVALANRSTPPGLASPGNTPARAAIAVAAAQLSGRDPGPERIILLIIDGVPDCKPGEPDLLASDADGAVQAIEDAIAMRVSTYVIGMGTAGGPADATLTRMAAAGGLANAATPSYVSVTGSGDLVNTMNNLVAQSADCVFAVPDPPRPDTDRANIRLEFPYGDRAPEEIPHDAMNGWDYTDDSMMGVQLHGSACDTARGSSRPDIVFLCIGP
jgi:hypothetical protein